MPGDVGGSSPRGIRFACWLTERPTVGSGQEYVLRFNDPVDEENLPLVVGAAALAKED